jgi:YHS domain-containing protein
MMVDPENAAGSATYEGKTYYFCSRGCKVAFTKDPQSYLGDQGGHQHQHQHHHHH